MKKFLLTIGCVGVMACCCVLSVEAQRGNRTGNSQETITRRSSGTVSSQSSSQRQSQSNAVSRRPAAGSTSKQPGATVSRRPSGTAVSPSTPQQQPQSGTVSRRPASNSPSSQKTPSTTIGNRRPGNNAATVVERHNRDNAGGRGQWRDDKNPSNVPHPGYTHQSPPPPGYHANRVPPHGYRFTPPPVGLGCVVGYNVHTPPPPRAHYYVLHGMRYYFYDRCFHALVNGVYQVVAAPFGLMISMLPNGCETLFYNNMFYYYYDGTFYRPVGTSFEVVAPRIGMAVPYLPNYGVSYVMYGGRPAYYYNGYYYYEQETPVGLMYRVVGVY